MKKDEITAELFRLRDENYAKLQSKIVPTVGAERIIGVRLPAVRDLAKRIYKDGDFGDFLADLPHAYYDEDQLHAFLISLEKDFNTSVGQIEAFLPYVDNWAVCDTFKPKAFEKEPERALPYIEKWLASGEVYTVRFAIGMLMDFFLGSRFKTEYADAVAAVRSDEYYVNMMIAWYFATALAKNYDDVIPYIEGRRLGAWAHNKTIQKCVESFRISDEHKEYLKTLKIK